MSVSELAEEEERRRKRAPWGVIALVLLTGLALIRNGSGSSTWAPAAGDGGGRGQPQHPEAPHRQAAPAPAVLRGRRVRIPAIQVDAPVTPVGLDMSGWVDAPSPDDPNLAGWFTGAVSPGENGTAVVVGHVDNMKGPAVFYGLGR